MIALEKVREKLNQEMERLWKLIPDADSNEDDWTINQACYLGAYKALESFETFIDSLTDEPEEKKGCGVEFPHFGAQYPDGKCINGYLWDMDSYEDGSYTIGGDDPCPICNTEEWLKDVLDDEIFKTREDALKYVEKLKSKYAYRNKPDEPVAEGLE